MKRMRWLFVGALLGIGIAVVALRCTGPQEPGYQGRSLSSWLDEWGNSYHERTNPAAIAIRAIGSNGLPILLARVSKDESPAKRKFWRIAAKVVRDEWNPIDRDINRAVTAAEAINLLGVEAKPAFPALTNLFSGRPHCVAAAIGLAGIGHEGVEVLLQALTNQDFVHRHSAAFALSEAGSDFDKVVPALIEVVKIGGSTDEDRLLRGAAASALVQLHKEPELVVPVFSEFLTSPDARMRDFGASVLGSLGADAKAAIPLLLKLRTDADPDVRESAARALREIDPKAAANAGLK